MLVKIYSVYVETHDYFEHYGAKNGSYVETFDNALDAYSFYLSSKKNDVHLESDYSRHTHTPKISWTFCKTIQSKHGLVIGHAPSKKDIALAKMSKASYDVIDYLNAHRGLLFIHNDPVYKALESKREEFTKAYYREFNIDMYIALYATDEEKAAYAEAKRDKSRRLMEATDFGTALDIFEEDIII